MEKDYKKLGGWLMVFTLRTFITVVTNIILVYNLFVSFIGIVTLYPVAYTVSNSVSNLYSFALAVNVLNIILGISLIVIFIKILYIIVKFKPQGHVLISRLLILFFLIELAMSFISQISMFRQFGSAFLTEDYVRHQITLLFIDVLDVVIWISYLKNSIRVKCFFDNNNEKIENEGTMDNE